MILLDEKGFIYHLSDNFRHDFCNNKGIINYESRIHVEDIFDNYDSFTQEELEKGV